MHTHIRRTTRYGWTLLLVGILLLPAGLSLAQPAAPKPRASGAIKPPPGIAKGTVPGGKAVAIPMFKQGIKKFDDGYYVDAIRLFRQAYYHYRSARIFTRIALCYKWLGNALKTLEFYEKYLKAVGPNPPKVKDKALRMRVVKLVAQLLKRIGQVRVVMEKPVGAEIRVNGRLLGNAPLNKQIRLVPGPVNVTAGAKNYHTFKRDLDVGAGQNKTVKITLIKIKRKIIIRKGTPVHKTWWLWTAVGLLVAGGVGLGVGLTVTATKRDPVGTPIVHDGLGIRW